MQLKEKIEEIVSERLSEEYFIVEIIIGGTRVKPKITILLDGDDGITIDYCAEISRKVANEIEEKNIIDTAYTLEVSSPGIDFPLKFLRQYIKNIGRKLEIELIDGNIKTGKLEEVNEGILYLSADKKKKTIEEAVKQEIKLEEIKKAVVIISFGD